MKKRQWAIIGGLLILVLSFVLKNKLSETVPEEKAAKVAPIKGITGLEIVNGSTPIEVQMDGKLNAIKKIELYAEVSGVLQRGRKSFEEGIRFKKGESLLELEGSEAEAAYLSAQSEYINVISKILPDIQLDYPEAFSAWSDYLNNTSKAGRINSPPATTNSQLRLFLTGNGLYSSFQNMESARIRLTKYKLVAPFDGIVTESNVDPGTLIRVGQRLGEFIAPGIYELHATISPADLELIELNDKVILSSPDTEGLWQGEIYRINAKVDPSTQRVKVFVKVTGENLRDGMFMNAVIEGRNIDNTFRLPRKLLYDNRFTYVVKNDTVLERRPLEIVLSSPGSVIARGLPDGAIIPNEPISGAYDGMRVQLIGKEKVNKAVNPSQNQDS